MVSEKLEIIFLQILFDAYLYQQGLDKVIEIVKSGFKKANLSQQQEQKLVKDFTQIFNDLKCVYGTINPQELARRVFHFFENTALEHKNSLIWHFDKSMKQAKELNASKTIHMFKTGITDNRANWKDVLLNASQTNLSAKEFTLKAKGVLYKSDKRAITPVERESERFAVKKNNYSYAIMGSTFLTGREPMATNESFINGDITKGLKEAPNVDAAFNKVLHDKKGNVRGFAFGVADGLGHPDENDKYQTADVTRVSYFSTKHFLRLASTFTDPNALKKAIPDLLEMTADAIQAKLSGKTNELTALAAGVAFLMPDGSYQIVGVNIGDCSLHAYNPYQKSFKTLAASRQVWDGRTGGPAAFPRRYKPHEIEIFNDNLPENTFIIGMSDGVSDFLPHDKIQTVTLLDYPLLPAKLNLTGQEQNGQEIAEQLTAQVIKNLEKERMETLQFVQNNTPVMQTINSALMSNDPNQFDVVFNALSEDLKKTVAHESDVKKKLIGILSEMDAKFYINLGDDYTLMTLELLNAEKRNQLGSKPLLLHYPNHLAATSNQVVHKTNNGRSLLNTTPETIIPRKVGYAIAVVLGVFTAVTFAVSIGLLIAGGLSPLGLVAGLMGITLSLSAGAMIGIDVGIMVGGGLFIGAAVLVLSRMAVGLFNHIFSTKNKDTRQNIEFENSVNDKDEDKIKENINDNHKTISVYSNPINTNQKSTGSPLKTVENEKEAEQFIPSMRRIRPPCYMFPDVDKYDGDLIVRRRNSSQQPSSQF